MSSKLIRRPLRSRSMRALGPESRVEPLESRVLLSTLPLIQPTYRLAPLVTYTSPPSGSFVPAQIQQAYQFNLVSGNGSGETIAIVDAYNDSSIQSDLNTFDTQFGLTSTTVSVVNQTGGSKLPSGDSTGGWEMEESLDVEWAHAMAPGAKILLVEANSPSNSDLLTAVDYASQHANVVSMSWGGGEFSGETSYDSHFTAPGVAYVVASGDSGAPAEWPAASPNVLSVGGTALTLNSSGGWGSETGWSGSTGGPSAYETQPTYQVGTVTGTTMRATPDVAYDGASTGTYAVYDSYPYQVSSRRTQSLGWVAVYGTSAGAPQWASILAIADQARTSAGLPALNASSPQQVMSLLYQNSGDFHDITSGTSTGNPPYTAGPGYDYVTGLGTPMVNMVVDSLAGGGGTTSDTIAVSAPSTTTAGTSISYTVTADGATGSVDTGFTGTISLSSSDGQIQGLPSSYTFTSTDQGTHTFTVTLETAGSQTITETSASGSVVSTIQVSPAAASKLVISGLSTAVVGTPQSFTVTAEDSYGNVATSYTGTVSFASTDTKATLPGNYTFTSTNAGQKAFSVTFGSTGTQNLTVTDTTNSSLTTTQSVNVSSPPPPGPQSIWGTSYPATVNAKYQGQRGQTFDLGVQFEASVAGNVTGVLFYKQPKTRGTNVGHLWSSSGTLLASVTFSNETGSGWQEANFASPVSISANTFYTISYDTGSPIFSYDSGYFASGGVTNGNLSAPQSTTINGVTLDNGVYNYGGLFPNTSQYAANFWVDLVFTPTTTGAAVGVNTPSPSAPRNGRYGSARVGSGAVGTPAGSATPAGPMGVLPGSQESPSTTAKRPSFSFAVVGYRPVVRQARMPVLWGHRPTSLSN